MTAAGGEKKKSQAFLGPAMVLVVLVVGAFFVLRTEGAPQEKLAAPEPVEAAPAAMPPPAPAPSITPALEHAADSVPFKPYHPSTPDPEGPMHPHPITPEHERIFKENNLFATISGAMDRKDTVAMRKFLEQYKNEYPEDSHLLQEGFAVIADCIDFPGEKSTAAARAYYSANKASIIRRYVRRHCFEQQPQ